MSQGEGALCRYNINGGSVVVGRMLNHTAPAGGAVCRQSRMPLPVDNSVCTVSYTDKADMRCERWRGAGMSKLGRF